jgi:hypothetical protein
LAAVEDQIAGNLYPETHMEKCLMRQKKKLWSRWFWIWRRFRSTCLKETIALKISVLKRIGIKKKKRIKSQGKDSLHRL